VTVDYGFDLHSICISEAIFAQVQAGMPVTVQGQGFPVEGVMEQDEWAFGLGAIHVSTVEGRDVFEGNLSDAEVDVRDE
jgi:hypothetical protein